MMEKFTHEAHNAPDIHDTYAPHGTHDVYDMHGVRGAARRGLRLTMLAGLMAVGLSAGAETAWWQTFRDPSLDSLVAVALERNPNVQMAQSRIEQARAAYRSALGAFAPDVTLQAGWQRSRSSQHLTETVLPATYESYYDGQLQASLALDIFGKLRRAADAKRAAWRASRAERDVVALNLCKEVATTYFSLCATRSLIRVTEANIAAQSEIAAVTRSRYDAGLASRLDVAQALYTLYNTQASITTYRADEVARVAQLAVLLGDEPRAFATRAATGDSLPSVEYLIPDTIGVALLRLRPDLRQEEWVIDEQAAALGVARKAWLPTVLINGTIGLAAHDADDLFRHRAATWQVAPVIQWTVSDGGQRVETIRQARAALQEQVDDYNLLLLTAMQQVESAAAAYRQSLAQVRALALAVAEAEEALSLSVELYKMGLTAFINVMQAQQSVLQYQTAWVTASLTALQNLVAYHTATSPGFTE